MQDTIINKLRSILSEELDLNLTADQMDENYPLFEDGLGLDSVVIVEFIGLIEERFEVEFSDDELSVEPFHTLKAIADCLEKNLSFFGGIVKQDIDPDKLSIFQKILLRTDGTLTEILEAYVSEAIHVVKLSETILTDGKGRTALGLEAGRPVIQRKILLQGKSSRKNFLYAQSLIMPDRLDEKFRHDLVSSRVPIGRLWEAHKVETFKEITACFRQPAGRISHHFGTAADDPLLCRTYKVYSNRKPIMQITEKFPESYYLHPPCVSP